MKKIFSLLICICLLTGCNKEDLNKGLTFNYSYDDISEVNIYADGQNNQLDKYNPNTETLVDSIISMLQDEESNVAFIDDTAPDVQTDDVSNTYKNYITILFNKGKDIIFIDEKEYKYGNVLSIALALVYKKDNDHISEVNIFLIGEDYTVYLGILENTPKIQQVVNNINNILAGI